VNDDFLKHIDLHAELQFLKRAKLFVYDGNHRLQALDEPHPLTSPNGARVIDCSRLYSSQH